jgi:hypothetical protein
MFARVISDNFNIKTDQRLWNMSFTMNELGEVLTETQDGVTMPIDCSFEKVNDWIHGADVQFEELQALCLGMSSENDKLRAELKKLEQTNDGN